MTRSNHRGRKTRSNRRGRGRTIGVVRRGRTVGVIGRGRTVTVIAAVVVSAAGNAVESVSWLQSFRCLKDLATVFCLFGFL